MNKAMRRLPILPVANLRWPIVVRWTVGALGLLLVLFASIFFSRIAGDPLRFPVTHVDVLGTLDYTDRESLRDNVMSYTQRGFYALDIDRIRTAVEAMPWVATAHVRRMWPGRVMIDVEEHEPAARWNDGSLISKRLELFQPPQLHSDSPRYAEWQVYFADLPLLRGASGRHLSVLESYRHYERVFTPLAVQIDALVEDERRSQTIELSNQVQVRLGVDSHELRLQRFIDIYERLVTPLAGQAAHFDMRYSNGFALSGASAVTRGS